MLLGRNEDPAETSDVNFFRRSIQRVFLATEPHWVFCGYPGVQRVRKEYGFLSQKEYNAVRSRFQDVNFIFLRLVSYCTIEI